MRSRRFMAGEGLTRPRLFFFLILCAMLGLLSFLWKVQVTDHQRYLTKGSSQSIRVALKPGLRGRILDRNGDVLADNKASHAFAIYMAEVRQDKKRPRKIVDAVEQILDEIGGTLGLDPTTTRADINKHWRTARYMPMIVWRGIDEETIARYSEQIGEIPGVAIHTEPERRYPHNDLACHILGYVGRGTKERTEEQKHWHMAPEILGRAGLEYKLDEQLRGEGIVEMIRIDARSYRSEVVSEHKPTKQGSDFVLSIHQRIQKAAEEVLGEDVGAICVVDVRNGDLLALASYPRYELQKMSPVFTLAYDRELRNDPRRPFRNHAIQTHAHPGSTFKPVVALAALQSGMVNSRHTVLCTKTMEYKGRTFRCTGYHGEMDLREALKRSCNLYFYAVSKKIEYTRIEQMARSLGMGSDFDLPIHDVPGLLPTREEKVADLGYWQPGQTLNASIGQGYIEATPLQMTMVTAAIANGGTVLRPRLILEEWPEGDRAEAILTSPRRVRSRLFTPAELRPVHEGMHDVIYGGGTAREALVDGIEYAGKTGTAQYGWLSDDDDEELRRYRGWMVAFAPYRQPQVAITIFIRETTEGSAIAVRKMKALMSLMKNWLLAREHANR